MRTFLASCLGLALVALAGAAPADEASLPSLPGGWVRGAGVVPLPPHRERGFFSFQSNHEFTFRVRRSMPGARRDVNALPVVPIEPSALPAAPPAELPEGEAGDVEVHTKDGYYRLSLRGFDIGFVQVNGSLPTAVGPHGEGGAVGACGGPRVVPVSYEGIRRVERGGGIELVWARGWFDAGRCRAAIVERHEALPEHLGGGVVYGFRTRCAACAEGARDVLHVLTPQTSDTFGRRSPFEHHTLPLGPGTAAAFEGGTGFRGGGWPELPDWEAAIDRRCGTDTIGCTKQVRVEVSQGRGEPSPTLFVSGDVGP
jgi:hypothetical protein